LEFDFPLHNAAGSQIFPLHYAAVNHDPPPAALCNGESKQKILGKILPLHNAAGSHDSPPHNAEESQILLLHDAAESPHWQRRVKSNIFGRLTKTLKEQ
jgi:hypothetical protein